MSNTEKRDKANPPPVPRTTKTTAQVLEQQQQDAERERAARQQLVPATSTIIDDDFGAPAADDRVIQGTLIKCTDGVWTDRDKQAVPAKLLVLATTTIVQRWRDQKPEETIIGRAGQALPDVAELNAKIPEAEWELGIDGRPRPPWQRQEIVYLLDERDAQKYTFASGTIGARIAAEELRDRVQWMRQLRGARVIPVVELANKPMRTRHGGNKLRPHFKIISWCELGGGPASEISIATEQLDRLAAPKAPPGIKTVAASTIGEELDDAIPL